MFKRWVGSRNKRNTLHKEKLESPNIQGALLVKSVDALLEQHTGHITQISELVGLSSINFDSFYLSAIQHFARFVQQLPASEVHRHAGTGGMLTHALEVCVIALKVRRSYLLSETGGCGRNLSKTRSVDIRRIYSSTLS